MPNIEIHGRGQNWSKEIENRIFADFDGKPYVDDMVVTTYQTKVKNRGGEDKPFIRLVSTKQEYLAEVVKILRKFGDLEVMILEEFFAI